MKQWLWRLLLASTLGLSATAAADWWSDNNDRPEVEDIDAGAQPETSVDQDLVDAAQGPGQPQDDPAPAGNGTVIYDAWGRPYGYGMPYGYGPGFGYGGGFIVGPFGGPYVVESRGGRSR